MKICYTPKKFNEAALSIINEANEIIGEFQAEGYSLTLRQLYYQFVRKDTLPVAWTSKITGSTNNKQSYKKMGVILNNARLAGLVDWSSLEDRTREPYIIQVFDNPKEVLEDAVGYFSYDLWDKQSNHVEVWVEKEAMSQIVKRACSKMHVTSVCCRGYFSQSAMYQAALRMRGKRREGKDCHVIYLGDHDPSGIDMSRDIDDRLITFKADVLSHRIALNRDQVTAYSCPPNPTKITDSRAKGYIREHGHDCWELDALSPSVLCSLIEDKLESLTDMDQMRRDLQIEEDMTETLRELAERF